MPRIRVAHRAAPVVPVRPTLSSHRSVAGPLANRRRPAAPRFLPILQAPRFPHQPAFIDKPENEQLERQHAKYNHSATVDNQHRRNVTQQISVRVPTFVPQQNYPKQPLPSLTTRPIRSAEPKYSSHFYANR